MEPDDGLNNKQNDTKETVIASSAEISSSTTQMSVDGGADDSIQDKPKKKSHAMAIGMVFLAILAIGGIGFGVWAMMDGNAKVAKKDEKISELNTQLAEAAESIVEEETTEVVDEEIEDDVENEDADTANYIYVGEWGLKIEVPDNLTVTGYRYSMLAGYTSVGVSGNTKGGQFFPDFADLSKANSPLGTIARYPKGAEMPLGSPPVLVFSDEQYDYYYYHPQMVISTEENEQKWEVESTDAIEKMLNNKDNYSKI